MNIELKQIAVTAGKDGQTSILRDVSHVFEQGSVTLVVGQTGSGKSTLLHAVSGLVPISSGAIRYGDKPLWNGSKVDEPLLLRTGHVFQYPERQLFADSVRKEFAYSLRPFRLSKQEAAKATHEALRQLALPASIVDESVFTLSDGWKRKAALGTTLAAKPAWLLLDEPTAGIDPQGIPPLLGAIRQHRDRAAGGVIIASHDMDAFLPLADQVVVMRRGRIHAVFPPAELYSHADALLEARVGLPASVGIAGALSSRGMLLPGHPLTPEQTAEAIVRALRNESTGVTIAANAIGQQQAGNMPNDEPVRFQAAEADCIDGDFPPPTGDKAAVSGLPSLHPIAKWLFYMAVSAGMLLQNSWIGIIVSTIITAALVRVSGTSYRTVSRIGKPFLVFILISGVLSGLRISAAESWWSVEQVHFSLEAAARTFRQLIVFLIVMAAGVAFVASTSATMMQRGLEQGLSFLERFRIPVSPFTFSASLLLRFIPMIGKEMDRMSLIVKARGKTNVKPGSIRLRDTPVFMIPLLLSMMKQAEDMALALEARGCKTRRLASSSSPPLKFRRSDWLAVGAGAAVLIVLLVIRNMTGTTG